MAHALETQSRSFQQATLRSERLRISGLVVVLLILLGVVLLRAALTGNAEQLQILPQMVALVGLLLAYEMFMLQLTWRMIRAEKQPPAWLWYLNVVIECLLPTAALILMTNSPFLGPYKSLVAPAILVYFIFIVLSTLRLSPALCTLTGVLSAAGYLAVTFYTFKKYPDAADSMPGFTAPVFITYGVFFLLGGLTAAAVARQIRSHVRAALREADTRRQVEQMEHDLGIARTIQQGLLPDHPPNVEGFEIAGWSKPADLTGGDYYDWQTLADGKLAVSLADVTGHGIGPALVTAVCRAYSRASFPFDDDLTTLVNRINNLLFEDLPSDRFVTFVVGVLDPAHCSMQLLSAGHGPIFVYRAKDGHVENHNAHGIPFGVDDGFEFGQPQQIHFDVGDMLLLITDGFFEWADDTGEQFGNDRLADTLRSCADQPPDKIIAQLYAHVLEFAAGTPQLDDLTALLVKRVPAKE